MFKVRVLIAVVMLIICSYQDLKRKEINLSVLILSVLINTAFVVIDETSEILKNNISFSGMYIKKSVAEIVMSVFPGIFILIFSKLFGQIGEGDGYVFIAIGLISGVRIVLLAMYISFLIGGIYAAYKRFIKKEKAEYGFAFVPFILIGYIAGVAQI